MLNDAEIAYFQRNLEINKHDLDTALIEQPSLYQKASEAYSEAISIRDGLKDSIKVAEGTAWVRELSVVDAKGKGPTVDTLVNLVNLDENVRELKKKYNYACQDVEILDGLREAYRERSYVLGKLCDLFLGSYFQKTSVGGSSQQEVKSIEHQKRLDNINDARTKKLMETA